MKGNKALTDEKGVETVVRQPSAGELVRLCFIVMAVSGVVGFMAFPSVESLWKRHRGEPIVTRGDAQIDGEQPRGLKSGDTR